MSAEIFCSEIPTGFDMPAMRNLYAKCATELEHPECSHLGGHLAMPFIRRQNIEADSEYY